MLKDEVIWWIRIKCPPRNAHSPSLRESGRTGVGGRPSLRIETLFGIVQKPFLSNFRHMWGRTTCIKLHKSVLARESLDASGGWKGFRARDLAELPWAQKLDV
jgi:hypothetical protein